ncbi:MAG: dihydrofolate reductase family protein [Arthrobacter sp.]
MRNVVLMMQQSLDGFIEGPDRDLSWHRVDEELHSHFNEVLRSMGAFLDGRVTYELMAEFWPTADQHPSSPASMIEFAGIWRDMPKVVYSRTLAKADWNTEVCWKAASSTTVWCCCGMRRSRTPFTQKTGDPFPQGNRSTGLLRAVSAAASRRGRTSPGR